MNFHLARSAPALPQRESSLLLLAQRAQELAGAAERPGWESNTEIEIMAGRLLGAGQKLDAIAFQLILKGSGNGLYDGIR